MGDRDREMIERKILTKNQINVLINSKEIF